MAKRSIASYEENAPVVEPVKPVSFQIPRVAGKQREGGLTDNCNDLQTVIATMKGIAGMSRPDFGRLVIFTGLQVVAAEMGYDLVADDEKGEFVLSPMETEERMTF